MKTAQIAFPVLGLGTISRNELGDSCNPLLSFKPVNESYIPERGQT